jgi:hypothetical protein
LVKPELYPIKMRDHSVQNCKNISCTLCNQILCLMVFGSLSIHLLINTFIEQNRSRVFVNHEQCFIFVQAFQIVLSHVCT